MTLYASGLVPSGGSIYCHVFENLAAGCRRQLFWSVMIDFAPVDIQNMTCPCSLIFDWIRWPVRNWVELDGQQLSSQQAQRDMEASFYLFAHHPANELQMTLKAAGGNQFAVSVSANVSFAESSGLEIAHPFDVQARINLPFTGLIMVPENLGLSQMDVKETIRIASEFVDLKTFCTPERSEGEFRFRPRY